MPTARPPACWIEATIDLLIEPDSTISTTDMVASSVTRRPSRNSGFTSSLSSMRLICGPAAMDDDGVEAAHLEHDHVARELVRELRVHHGVAAIFHHDDLVVVALQEGQRLGEDVGRFVEWRTGSVMARSVWRRSGYGG